MQQQHYVNPATVLDGRKQPGRIRRRLALQRAIPFFWAARDTLGIIMLIPLYFWLRLPNLLALPIFYDETIYLDYAREYMADPVRNVLISAERDGKPPLFIWGLSWFWHLFDDPLAGGRFMSVLGGGLACIFVYLIGKRLHSATAGFLASLFFILNPIMVLHNRLAVHTSWETAAGMATLYFAIAIGQQPRAVYALGLGASIGLGLLIKQNALFYFGLAPLVAFMVSRHPEVAARYREYQTDLLRRISLWWYRLRVRRLPNFGLPLARHSQQLQLERESSTLEAVTAKRKRLFRAFQNVRWRNFLFMAVVGFVGIAIAGAVYLPLQTHPQASFLSSTDTSYALTFKEILGLPFDLWRDNISQTWEWWLTYYSIPMLVLVLASIGYAVFKPKFAQSEIVLLAWAVLPVFAQIILARQHWFTRYITAFAPPLMLLAAIAIMRLSKYVIKSNRERMGWTGISGALFGVCLSIIVIIPWLSLDDQLLNRPVEAQLSSKDRWQYIEGWPSGYGIEDSITYIKDLAAVDPLLLYLDQNNVTPELYYVTRLSPLKGWIFFGRTNGVNWLTRNFRGERNTYYLTTVTPDEMLLPYLKLVKVFPKPGGKSSIAIYHFVPPSSGPELTITGEGG